MAGLFVTCFLKSETKVSYSMVCFVIASSICGFVVDSLDACGVGTLAVRVGDCVVLGELKLLMITSGWILCVELSSMPSLDAELKDDLGVAILLPSSSMLQLSAECCMLIGVGDCGGVGRGVITGVP